MNRTALWLRFAAAPTFAVMAGVTVVLEREAPVLLCSGASPFGGMAVMYGLMSAFHLAPWLALGGRSSRI